MPVKNIAQAVGEGLKPLVRSLTPDEAAGHFGWLAMFAAADLSASSPKTRKQLGWTPTGTGLIIDLKNMRYA